MWGRGDPKPGRRRGRGRALAPKVPVPLAAVQQSSPEGETQEAAAEVVSALCQLEVGEPGREEFLVCLAHGLGLNDGGSPGRRRASVGDEEGWGWGSPSSGPGGMGGGACLSRGTWGGENWVNPGEVLGDGYGGRCVSVCDGVCWPV